MLGTPSRASADDDYDDEGDEPDDSGQGVQGAEAMSPDLRLIIPRPPEPPAGRYVSPVLADAIEMFRPFELAQQGGLGVFDPRNLKLPGPPPPRDPHAFYWKGGRPFGVSDVWSLECEEFRHGLDPEVFDIHLVIDPRSRQQPACHGNLQCRVSASNVAEPIVRNIPITIRFRQESTLAIARQWQLAPPAASTSPRSSR